MGGGNKHKNGIICTFPGCEKTMRTQKFKLHFTKQHLKPGEAYSVEHRRQYEVARDDEYVTDNTIAAAAAAAMKQQVEPHAAVSMQIPTVYHTTAPALSSLAPTFTPPAGAASSSSTDSSPDGGESADDKRMMQHYEETAQMEQQIQQQQRLSSSRVSAPSAAPLRLVAQRAAAAAATAVDAAQRPSHAHEAVSPLRSSSKRSAVSALELAAAATATDDGADPTRAMLIKYIELMDARYHELVQSMSHVVEGQRELIEILRRPIQPSETTTPALEQPPPLGQQIQSQTQLADTSGRKRRKVASASEQQQSHGSSSASGASTLL